MAHNGLKKGSFHLLVHPKWCRIIFGNFFDPFCSKPAHFQGILGFYEGQNGTPRVQNAPKPLRLGFHVAHGHFLKRVIFCARWTLLSSLAPTSLGYLL